MREAGDRVLLARYYSHVFNLRQPLIDQKVVIPWHTRYRRRENQNYVFSDMQRSELELLVVVEMNVNYLQPAAGRAMCRSSRAGWSTDRVDTSTPAGRTRRRQQRALGL